MLLLRMAQDTAPEAERCRAASATARRRRADECRPRVHRDALPARRGREGPCLRRRLRAIRSIGWYARHRRLRGGSGARRAPGTLRPRWRASPGAGAGRRDGARPRAHAARCRPGRCGYAGGAGTELARARTADAPARRRIAGLARAYAELARAASTRRRNQSRPRATGRLSGWPRFRAPRLRWCRTGRRRFAHDGTVGRDRARAAPGQDPAASCRPRNRRRGRSRRCRRGRARGEAPENEPVRRLRPTCAARPTAWLACCW